MASKEPVCVAIPIYRAVPDENDLVSLDQCSKVLGGYRLVFVTHADLDVSEYQRRYPSIGYAYFDAGYFSSVDGYNALMLSRAFYQAFEGFEYLLIYQTDAYVFRDELSDWCSRGYDYVGGLWPEVEEGVLISGVCGNGGLSLRKVSTFLKITQDGYRVLGWKDLVRKHLHYKQKGRLPYLLWYTATLLPKLVLFVVPRFLGYKNTFRSIKAEESIGEDRIYAHKVMPFRKLAVPHLEGAGFSWELNLEVLWRTFQQLPFGCHGWSRGLYFGEDVTVFWKKHILPRESRPPAGGGDKV